MAPGYRPNNHSRRANRTYIDHDVFEGLPVRNWRRDTIAVVPPEVHDMTTQKDKWDIELPYGMPKDSNLLPQHSQDLLRAARSGKLYVKRAPPEEEEVETEATVGEKPEKKENLKERGFMVKAWRPVPRHLEGPEIEYLAKRRKGLVTPAVRSGNAPGPALTKTKVRRTDAAGNTYVEDIVVPEGQAVEGEVISQTIINKRQAARGATDAQNAQPVPRRRPPPPKRKAKGTRGRKRKLPLPPTSVPSKPAAVKMESQVQEPKVQEVVIKPDVTVPKLDLPTPTANDNDNENEDTEMGDGSILPSDEEADDGEEGATDDEEVENDRGVSDQDEELGPATSGIPVSLNQDKNPGQQRGSDVPPTPPPPAVPLAATTIHHHEFSGSPLKKVVTPPEYSASFGNSSLGLSGDEEADGDLDDDDVDERVHDVMENVMHDEGAEDPYQMVHDLSLENSGGVVSFSQPESGVGPDGDHLMAMHHLDEMLLDSLRFSSGMVETEESGSPIHSSHPFSGPGPHGMDTAAQDLLDTAGRDDGDDDDGFEDLLGSLEDHLNDQATAAQNETSVFTYSAAELVSTPDIVGDPFQTFVVEKTLSKESEVVETCDTMP